MRTILLLILLTVVVCSKKDREVQIITVVPEYNDAVDRLLRSARNNGYNVKVLHVDSTFDDNIVEKQTFHQKLAILRSELADIAYDQDTLLLCINSHDVILLGTKDQLLEEYENIGKKVVFGADAYCWPKPDLAEVYPAVRPEEKRFLNSAAFIGPAAEVYRMINAADVLAEDDDEQTFYTKIFLDEALRKELDIGLDTTSRIFQNLNGSQSEVELRFTDETGYLVNTKTNTKPIVVHGNGPIKPLFNSLTNYLDHNWTPNRGCQQCEENTIDMFATKAYPEILLSIFIDKPTPFLEVFFQRIAQLTYPKDRVHLMVYIAPTAEKQMSLAEAFISSHGHKYRTSTTLDNQHDVKNTGDARRTAFAHCLAIEDCQFLFAIAGTVQLTNPDTIQHLVHMNRSMLAPMVYRREKLWSNFWGALSPDGYYERADDYVDIVEGTKTGIWNVPFVRDVYLLSRPALRKLIEFKFVETLDLQMQIAKRARENNIFMMIDNQRPYGYLIYDESYTVEHVNNDLWQIFDNPLDWAEQYVHPNYFALLPQSVKMTDFAQPCPDVFYFPIVTEKFCKQLIEEMENFGQWSDGSNTDPRLEGGYENVPTRDIHMRQINWEEHWLHFLVKYIHPIQKKVFEGYEDKPWARMNFVVRYRPDEQASLRPHHDASSFTLALTLNRPGIDFQGGGTRFVRYNCSVTKPNVGWTLMFPGRVTHLHEGLTTTSGTRYIFVTFVNP